MNTQNYLAFYSNLILQGDFATSREFHLHVTFITELQKYLAVHSIQLILQRDFATFREFPLRSIADKSMCLHSQPLNSNNWD